MDTFLQILKQYWGYDSFRGIQEEIIRSISSGKDTLGLMPTGGGKSITFQIPALCRPGLCLVVSPLIALMKDQVQNLRSRGIKATAVYSGMTRQEIIVALENCIFGDYKFLYISPERLDTEIFRTKLRSMKINLIAVDESHCISQWGYDFRPSYLKIAEIREWLPDIPILALTATATPEVVKDIQKRLKFKEENVFKMSFERKNLAYIVRKTEDKEKELLHILSKISGSAIVYTRTRKQAKETATWLNSHHISAEFYHAGLDNETKDLRQKKWQAAESRVMVATNAFGMGIDKPDVRTVIHTHVPDSPESYFQEAGRGGRDGQKAYTVLLYGKADRTTLNKRIQDTFPDKEYIKEVYEHLNYYYQMAMGDGMGCVFDFNLEEFCRKFKHFPVPADSALKILSQAGYIEYTEEQDNASRLVFLINREELYKIHESGSGPESVIQAVLRMYTGVFTDYAYINEDSIAIRCGLSRQQVYEYLKGLDRHRIIDYIPRKKTPFIIYTRERVELRHLSIPAAVYEERKERYTRRIRAMIDYAENPDTCRSRILLHYFGEQNDRNCMQCDICTSKHSSGLKQGEFDQLQARIMANIQKQTLTPAQLTGQIDEEPGKVQTVLRYLFDEEKIKLQNGTIVS